MQRKKRQQQTDPANDASGAGAWVGELEDQPIDADHHQDQRNAGVGDHGKQAHSPVRVMALDSGASCSHCLWAGSGLDGLPVELGQQVIKVVSQIVDYVQLQCLGCRQTDGLAHSPFGPFGISLTQLRQAANISGCIVHLLAAHGVATLFVFFIGLR